jgi:hypothetical protein
MAATVWEAAGHPSSNGRMVLTVAVRGWWSTYARSGPAGARQRERAGREPEEEGERGATRPRRFWQPSRAPRRRWSFRWVLLGARRLQLRLRRLGHAGAAPRGRRGQLPARRSVDGGVAGLSVFATNDQGEIFHTYSSYSRGLDPVNGGYHLLDLTPRAGTRRTCPRPWPGCVGTALTDRAIAGWPPAPGRFCQPYRTAAKRSR